MDRKILPYKKLKFFFDESEIEKRRLKKQTKKPQSKQKTYDCTTCPLDKSLKVKGYGKNTDYLFIARDPGREEVVRGRPLIGASGTLLRDGLYAFGFDLDVDGHADNVVSCRPPKNKYSKLACKCCYASLEQKLRNYKPKVIVTLGREATERILGDCNSIEAFRCIPIPSHKYNCIVFPLFHPAAILRARKKHDEEEYYKDLKLFVNLRNNIEAGKLNIPRFLKETKPTYSIEKITDVVRLEEIADLIYEQGIFAVDFEGNTAKAYLEGSELWMIGLAYPFPDSSETTKGYYIPYHENYGVFNDAERAKIEEIIIQLTTSTEIMKVIQNSKHEDSYLRNFFGVELKEPIACTMIQRHILNSRKKITSLRNQVLMAYGVTYKDKTDPKLQVQKGETFNRIYEIPIDDLGNRCALDSIYAYNLYGKQNMEFNNSPLILRDYCVPFFMKGAKVFANYEERGMNIDLKLLNELDQKWKEKSESLEKALLKMPTVTRFNKKLTGKLNLNSPQQLSKLLFDKNYYGLQPIRLTELTQNPSTDAETLQLLSKDNYFCKVLLDKRKLDNLRSTYVDNIRRYIGADGRLHPSFWLNIAETFRSSSSEPNFQNYPKRYDVGEDLEAKEIRKVFVPSYPDWEIREVDYKGNEVKGLWMLCRDPQLLEDLNNDLDMHRYFAALLFGRREDEVNPQERQRGKNEFVFATFYGASFRSIAEMMGLPEDHIQWCQNHLFSRYPGIRDWQVRAMDTYNKTGYSNLLTGFRRERPLDWTKVINTPIQGTSFHLLLNSCIGIEKLEGFKTKACGQIHDSIYFDGPIEERDKHIEAVTEIMVNLPWEWAKGVKIEVDWACGPNWMELKKVKV